MSLLEPVECEPIVTTPLGTIGKSPLGLSTCYGKSSFNNYRVGHCKSDRRPAPKIDLRGIVPQSILIPELQIPE